MGGYDIGVGKKIRRALKVFDDIVMAHLAGLIHSNFLGAGLRGDRSWRKGLGLLRAFVAVNGLTRVVAIRYSRFA